ncbi:MAG: baseplate J/gp47 family protein [Anaerolineae bacterium]|nr:baseplate J/gp47 family protein [Anaerolineae bacterium]
MQRTILEALSAGLADLEALRLEITKGGYLELASGDWLDLVAENMYGLARQPAGFCRQTVRLTAQAGFGPYTIQPGQLWASTPSGLRFNNTQGGTLAQGGTLDLEFKAESPGAAYNVAPGTITVFNTPLPGVNIGNLAIAAAGVDEETDDNLRLRCRLRWASLGTGATADAYRYWALSADPTITKVRVLDQNPRGQGTVDVIVWGEGGLGAGAVAAADAYIQQRKPLTSDVQVYAATPTNIAVTATITLRAGFLAATQAEVTARLSDLQRSLPIGGTLYRSALIEALFGAYVINVNLTAPAADVALGTAQAGVLVPNLTYQEA